MKKKTLPGPARKREGLRTDAAVVGGLARPTPHFGRAISNSFGQSLPVTYSFPVFPS